MPRRLIVIYGPPLGGKTTAAREIATSFDGKTAVVSVDALLRESIAVPDEDELRELEMVHVQLRLLVAHYLKNGYNVVVEGPFIFERDGRLHNFEREIGQLAALMRNLATQTLVVRLTAPEATLVSRGSTAEAATAARIESSYRERFSHSLTFDSGAMAASEIAAKVKQALSALPA